jgi:hypothetical protein
VGAGVGDGVGGTGVGTGVHVVLQPDSVVLHLSESAGSGQA